MRSVHFGEGRGGVGAAVPGVGRGTVGATPTLTTPKATTTPKKGKGGKAGLVKLSGEVTGVDTRAKIFSLAVKNPDKTVTLKVGHGTRWVGAKGTPHKLNKLHSGMSVNVEARLISGNEYKAIAISAR
jgi:hypothetical protein